ncbi:MAG: glycosyltransferase family 9 protein [Planctomycetaceae bacterium]|nr:glycosyltransferase family 9 protein [Planctomycetaceae bacterium]
MIATDPSRVRRVLILKPSSLGDVVTAVPVLRALRRQHPEAHITWMLSTTCAPVLAHDSDLDEVLLFDRKRLGRCWRSPAAAGELARFLLSLRRGRYDWVLDLQGLLRSGIFSWVTRSGLRAGFADAREAAWLLYTHRVRTPVPHTVDRNLALAAAVGLDARGQDMTLQVSPAAREGAAALLAEHGLGQKRFMVAVPPTRWATKQYPVRHWRAVVGALARRLPVVLLGSYSERALCAAVAEGLGSGVIDLSGRTDAAHLVAMIAAGAAVVCCDSAAKFIAPAVGVDVVTLIGPTRPERTGAYLRGTNLVSDVPCQGCLRRRCEHVTCMQSIEPAAVVAAVTAALDAGGF